MTPPPSDADKPGSGGRKPDPTAGKPGQPNPPGTGNRPPSSAPATPGGAKPGAPGTTDAAKTSQNSSPGLPPKPATEPVVSAKPGTTDGRPESGKPGSGTEGLKPSAGPAAQASAAQASAAQPSAAKPDALKAEPAPSGSPKAEPPRPSTAGSPNPGGVGSGPATSASTASSAESTAPGTKPGGGAADPAKAGPTGSGPQSGARPGGPAPGAAGTVASAAITAGPIIDMKANRIPDPATSGKEPGKDATKDATKGGKEPPKGPIPAAAADTARSGNASSARARAGFGSLATAGLLGGVIGAGLLFGAEKAGIGPDPRLNTVDQKLSEQIASLDKRVEGLAPRDALTALDKRVGAAESTAKQALDKTGATPVAPSQDGQASAQAPSVPADLVARLDSLDQRMAALQEEPGRDQPGDSKLNAVPGSGQQLAAFDARLKALEDKSADSAAGGDVSQKIAALQSTVDQKTKANADADAALGQRVDSLQQALDARVKDATEAVQAATQASRTAAEVGQAQAAETAKAVDRRLQEQADKIAALDNSVAQRAEVGTVQAALRVVVADRVAAALESGMPYAEPLAALRKLDPAADAQAQALTPFADTGAPTASQLAHAFRPIAERIATKRQAQRAKSAAETGDFRSKLLSMADGLVQVRKVDAPVPEAATDPEGKVQGALDRGDLPAAASAFAALPAEARDQAGDFGAKLKARAEAEQAVRTLLDGAFKALPVGAAASAPAQSAPGR